jgi:putative membrane protein insertion efficiency factor
MSAAPLQTVPAKSGPDGCVLGAEHPPQGKGVRTALAAIRAYQGLRNGQTSPCRFYPSCSAYAAEAVEEHGVWRGGLLAGRRIARCRPFGGRGVDLVPLRDRDRDRKDPA